MDNIDWFKIEDMWKHYLSKVHLTEEKMHAIQLKETKQAFYAACGEMLHALKHKVSELSEEDGIKQLQSYDNQVLEYFKELVK